MEINDFIAKKLKKKFGKRFEQNVLLKNLTTFHIGGPARFLVSVKSAKEIKFVLKLAKKTGKKAFVIGAGSNILAKDEGFSGILIDTNCLNKIKVKGKKIVAYAGLRLGKLVLEAKKFGLSGLEWAIGIPGTIGGAVVMNAGAFGGEIANFVEKVVFLDNTKKRCLKQKKIDFSYRHSMFQNSNLIVLKADFRMNCASKQEIEQKINYFVNLRKNTQNVGFFSAGSVFKKVGNIPASKLIDMAGLKGKRIGGAMVSKVHAGFIVNVCKANFKDVANLVDFISSSVYNKFGEKLELEIIVLGD